MTLLFQARQHTHDQLQLGARVDQGVGFVRRVDAISNARCLLVCQLDDVGVVADLLQTHHYIAQATSAQLFVVLHQHESVDAPKSNKQGKGR